MAQRKQIYEIETAPELTEAAVASYPRTDYIQVKQEEEKEAEIAEVTATPLTEEEEKMYGEVGYVEFGGPTTFDEVEAEEEMREKTNKVMHDTYTAERLVRNILRMPEGDVNKKADLIAKVGSDFAERVKMTMNEADEKEFDYDLAQIEILTRQLDEDTGPLEKIWHKAVLSSASRSSLSDSDFALVVKRDGKTVRKYPIHDKAHVRNALARAAQMIKKGGQAAADARAALPKIRAAAKRMGIGEPSKKSQNGVIIEKDTEGLYRWIGWVSNNFKDRDGDIIEDAAHKEYIAFLDENPDAAPMFQVWHTPGTERKSAVDAWIYENGFLIMSGPLTENEAKSLMEDQKEFDIGMSHGFIALRDPQNRNIITKYRTYEVSDLPLEHAANPWTELKTDVSGG